MEEGTKHDNGKVKINLIIPEFIEEMARILTCGAEKYEAYNWQKLDNDRIHNALLRHALKTTANKKVENTEDFGGLEEAYVAVNCMFLWWKKQNEKLSKGE